MVHIEIDGIPIQARDGAMIIEAADEAGIPIARFCYHKKLSVAANCRMCLVEVEKARKPLPACATPVTEGMKVYTRSPMALDAQRGTMEFLLINHPLDCPVCDQGGECDLQEMSLGYGEGHSRYVEAKRAVPNPDLGPLIATEMTRCIHCTRCVRFGEEIAGIKELGATGRGEHTRIGTYVQRTVDSELSGNVIDLCPVGALTSKPFRFTARPWELASVEGVSPHDALGSNLYLQARGQRVMRVLPRENEAINETWLSDRDRFSYEGLDSPERLRVPLLRRGDGRWEEVDWEEALGAAAEALKGLARQGGELGCLVSPACTVEEMYLAQALTRGLGSPHVDHRLREQDFRDQEAAPLHPGLDPGRGAEAEALARARAVLLVGADLRQELPLLAHRVRQAALAGARVGVLGSVHPRLRHEVDPLRLVPPSRLPAELAAVVAALAEAAGAQVPERVAAAVAGVRVEEAHRRVAEALREAGAEGWVLLGLEARHHPEAALLRALAGAAAELSGARQGQLSDGPNGAGGWLAGALPHRGPMGRPAAATGLDARAMLEQPRRGYLLVGLEPHLDLADPARAREALAGAEAVVALSAYDSEPLREVARVLLPMAAFAETSGTYVNLAGRWQSFRGAVQPPGEARPGWKILRVLGNRLGLEGFRYLSSEEVRDELRGLGEGEAPAGAWTAPAPAGQGDGAGEGLERVAPVPLYATDPVVRRAPALQRTRAAREAGAARLHPATARALGLEGAERVALRRGEEQAVLPLVLDEGVPEGAVW
ncbi:MAG: NADH-quinone oxidoreductase subunit G, partial [Gammaproteobacteria bacterium]